MAHTPVEYQKVKTTIHKIEKISLFVLCMTCSCFNTTTHVDSRSLSTPSERISALSRYFVARTELLDAEFDIFDVNLNARNSIPGPTCRDYKIALFVSQEDINTWLTDVVPTSFPLDYSWAKAMIQNNSNFAVKTQPLMYTGDHRELVLFKHEGIILIRIKQE